MATGTPCELYVMPIPEEPLLTREGAMRWLSDELDDFLAVLSRAPRKAADGPTLDAIGMLGSDVRTMVSACLALIKGGEECSITRDRHFSSNAETAMDLARLLTTSEWVTEENCIDVAWIYHDFATELASRLEGEGNIEDDVSCPL